MLLNARILKKYVIKELIDVFVFASIPDKYKTQEICNIPVSLRPLLIVFCPDKYKTQIMCDEAIDDSAAALKLILDWFVTSKKIKKKYTALYAFSFFYDDSGGNVKFLVMKFFS